MKRNIINWLPVASACMLLASCAEDYKDTIPMPEKPADVALSERLASYDVLDKYAAEAAVELGVAVDPSAFAGKELAFSIVKTNFNQVESAVAITPLALKTDADVYDFTPLSDLVETAEKSGIAVFGPALCSNVNIPSTYLKSTIQDVVIPYEPWNEEIVMFDFENDAIGTAYASMKKDAASSGVAVMEDPLGIQGKVLGGAKLTMDAPVVEVSLPDGLTVADVSRVKLKCLVIEGSPTAAKVQIESSGLNDKENPYKSKGVWEEYIFDLSKVKFKASELALNKFTLAVGAYGSGVVCCVDDITLRLEHRTGDDTVIVKTPEEKTEIIRGELFKWVDGITDICASHVKDYIIFDQPLESVNAKFFWSDYLGDGYVAEVQKAVADSVGAGARFFVSQNLSVSDSLYNQKVADLKSEVQKLQGSGVKVDGINIVLDTAFTLDEDVQADINAVTSARIGSLASLGMPVRISLKVNVIGANPVNLSAEQRQAVGAYYELIISGFIKSLGSNALGLSLSSLFDTEQSAAPWLQNGNRSLVYEGIVNGMSK
ncbi:MAG: hypothetical protein K2H49_01235 [Muribaculaceae bacterium]|nr:hypothetical protein [Muribaculaceae bacterium]